MRRIAAECGLTDVAVRYSDADSFILEMEVGQVDRGADISWLSQFPHEKEVLFQALSNVELREEAKWRLTDKGAIRVYPVRLSGNLKSKTLGDFGGMRRDLHLSSFNFLLDELPVVLTAVPFNSFN